MLRTAHGGHISMALLAGVTMLWLAGCGGSTNDKTSHDSRSSAAAAVTSSASRTTTDTTATSSGSSAEETAVGDEALFKYAECMRAHGIQLPPPDTSGPNPKIDTTGVDTSSSRYKRTGRLCLHIASAYFHARLR